MCYKYRFSFCRLLKSNFNHNKLLPDPVPDADRRFGHLQVDEQAEARRRRAAHAPRRQLAHQHA